MYKTKCTRGVGFESRTIRFGFNHIPTTPFTAPFTTPRPHTSGPTPCIIARAIRRLGAQRLTSRLQFGHVEFGTATRNGKQLHSLTSVAKSANNPNRLAKTHLIGENIILLREPFAIKPVETLDLTIHQFTSNDICSSSAKS